MQSNQSEGIRGRHQKLKLSLGPSLSKCNQEPVAGALFKYGVYESMQTGARRLWREVSEVKVSLYVPNQPPSST